MRKASESRTPLDIHREDLPYHINSHDNLNNSREISLRSFGRPNNPLHEDLDLKLSPRRNYTQQELETFDPKTELLKIQGHRR